MSLWMQPQFIDTNVSDLEKAKSDLEILEVVIEKQKEEIRSYTPKHPMIGMSLANSNHGAILNNGKLYPDQGVDDRSHTPDDMIGSDEGSEELEDDNSTETVEDDLRMDDSQDQM